MYPGKSINHPAAKKNILTGVLRNNTLSYNLKCIIADFHMRLLELGTHLPAWYFSLPSLNLIYLNILNFYSARSRRNNL